MIPPAGLRELGSTLGRLFMYSKDSLVLAHENFTTEAVAACIRADPGPMLVALREVADLEPPLSTPVTRATWLRVQTQVFLPGGGFLDAVLTLGNDAGVIGEVWLETKIDSKEGVDQLKFYATEASSLTTLDGVPRDVIALSKVRLQPKVSWLDWRRLYAVASRSRDPWWQDLRGFMEETQVSDAALLPISDREAGSISDAARMFTKVSEVIRQVNRRAAELWPEPPIKNRVHWGAEGALLNHVGAIFRQRGRMTADGALLRYGAVDADGTAHWYLAVPARGQRAARLEQMVSRAIGRGLGSDWVPQIGAEEFIARTVRVASCSDHQHAVAWFAEGLAQLQASGLLGELAAATMGEATGTDPQNAVASPPG